MSTHGPHPLTISWDLKHQDRPSAVEIDNATSAPQQAKRGGTVRWSGLEVGILKRWWNFSTFGQGQNVPAPRTKKSRLQVQLLDRFWQGQCRRHLSSQFNRLRTRKSAIFLLLVFVSRIHSNGPRVLEMDPGPKNHREQTRPAPRANLYTNEKWYWCLKNVYV